MSIGEVLVIVRSMNGGDASGDVQALGTAISETWRIGNVLMMGFPCDFSGEFDEYGIWDHRCDIQARSRD